VLLVAVGQDELLDSRLAERFALSELLACQVDGRAVTAQ
jgi:hypothetical protein